MYKLCCGELLFNHFDRNVPCRILVFGLGDSVHKLRRGALGTHRLGSFNIMCLVHRRSIRIVRWRVYNLRLGLLFDFFRHCSVRKLRRRKLLFNYRYYNMPRGILVGSVGYRVYELRRGFLGIGRLDLVVCMYGM